MTGATSPALVGPGWPRLGIRPTEHPALAFAASLFTLVGVVIVNPGSIAFFAYYLLLWLAFILVFHREEAGAFCYAYLINSAFIAAFYLIQTNVYPDSYGTTSPLGSWTDDSYFFALAADSIPANLLIRDNYFLYSNPFTTLINSLTPMSIAHPMDAIFFQSGVAALLATFSRRFTIQLSGDARLGNTVYTFAVICPFLMMNGGVILLRDTFAAALLIYSMACLNARRFGLSAMAIAFQLAIRPGTGLILLPAYAVIYSSNILALLRRHPLLLPIGTAAIVAALATALTLSWDRLLDLAPDFLESALFKAASVDLLGRELFADLTADPGFNNALLAIQELPFAIRFVLNGAYIFLYPFLNPRVATAGQFFDIRALTLNLFLPIYAFWLNAWFIAGAITKARVARRQRAIVWAIVVALLLIGTYSLQTRHKTILYPLYYFIVAIGFRKASAGERRVGYACSAFFLLIQVVFALR